MLGSFPTIAVVNVDVDVQDASVVLEQLRGLEVRVQGLGFEVRVFGVQDYRFGIHVLGLWVLGLGFRV